MDLFLTRDNSANSLSSPSISPIIGKVTVPVVTLDAYCQRVGIRQLDLLKLDVEGAELLALKGAQAVLTKMRPVIVMEASERTTARFGYTTADLIAFLERQGYRVQRVPMEENVIAMPIK